MPGKKEEIKRIEEGKKKQETQLSLPTDTMASKRVSVHQKSGLIFPVTRIRGLIRKGRYADKISPKCAIGVAAVLEYLTAEIIEMSGDNCFDGEHNVISTTVRPRHISLAIKGDEEMNRALGPDVIIPMGGVIPFIHEELENKKRRKNKAMNQFKDDEAEVSDSEADEEESTEEDEDEDEEEEEEA